jgi:hypothetical protein
MSMLMRLSEPLAPVDRSKFLADVAHELKDTAEIGDGLVGRVGREVQARYFKPLDLSRGTGAGRHRK